MVVMETMIVKLSEEISTTHTHPHLGELLVLRTLPRRECEVL